IPLIAGLAIDVGIGLVRRGLGRKTRFGYLAIEHKKRAKISLSSLIKSMYMLKRPAPKSIF
ncbi:hypothetical protein, partial [Pediococcus acidilactici]|uniref:hypothetical protein n=1 Tax=Pediococcus acidilactici TaxID=1254 RepID=UPI001E582D90